MGINIPGHFYAGVTEAAGNLFYVHSGVNQERGVRMAEVVYCNLVKPGFRGSLFLCSKKKMVFYYFVSTADSPVFRKRRQRLAKGPVFL